MSGGRWKIRWNVGGTRGRGEATPAGRAAGRAFGTLFFGLFFGMGAFFLVLIAREAWRGAETFGWAERRCEIERSEVVREDGAEPYRATVAFHTVDAGAEVSGRQLQRRQVTDGSYGDAAARLAAYPVSAVVPCYVSPQREAVLERGPLWIALWMLLPLVFVAIGGVGLVATWRPQKRDRFGHPALEPLASGAASSRPGRALVVIGCVFAALGGATFWLFAARPLAQVVEARSWDRERCTVEHSSVVSHRSDDGTTYSVDILYRWDRGRGVERSSRYSFFGGSSSGHAGKAEIVRAHPVGGEIPCWVDPERSNEAVLERGFTLHAIVAAIPLAFFAVGVGLVVAGRRKARRRARMKGQAGTGAYPFAPDDAILDVLPEFELSPGPVTLSPQSSRWGRVFGITFMAIFWNGIVSVFAYQVWDGWQRGRPEWFLTLFLVPFVLVGIALVLAIFHSILALANPRPTLVIGTRTPRLGEEVGLEWRFEGRTERLERLRISLKGKEQATYQVGTDTRTATEVFFEHAVIEMPGFSAARGQARFTLPVGSMHSFQSDHNQIRWELELRGEVPRWPDVSETYPLVVLPRAGEAKQEE